MSEAGILEAYSKGFLTSASIRVNGSAFKEGVNDVLPQCFGMGLEFHLNFVEGKISRVNDPKLSLLYDSSGTFRLGFGDLWKGQNNKILMKEIEEDLNLHVLIVY